MKFNRDWACRLQGPDAVQNGINLPVIQRKRPPPSSVWNSKVARCRTEFELRGSLTVKAAGLPCCAASGTLPPEHKVSIPDDIKFHTRLNQNLKPHTSTNTCTSSAYSLFATACLTLKMGPIFCSHETSMTNYRRVPRRIPKQ